MSIIKEKIILQKNWENISSFRRIHLKIGDVHLRNGGLRSATSPFLIKTIITDEN